MDQIKPAVSNAHRICRVNHRLASDVIRNRLADLLLGSQRRRKKEDVCPTRDVTDLCFGWVRDRPDSQANLMALSQGCGQRRCHTAPSYNSNLHRTAPCLAGAQDIWVGKVQEN